MRKTTLITLVALSLSLVTLGALAGGKLPKVLTRGSGKALSGADLLALYGHWFAKPYEYMFDSGTLNVNGRDYGMLKAGIDGILKYGALNDAAAKLLKEREPSFGDLTPIGRLAGLEVYKKEDTQGTSFSHLNPAIIKWGYQRLIPKPTDKVAGHTCAALYQNIFQRFFRLMTDAYRHLEKNQLWDKDRAAYEAAMKGGKRFDGINWLHGRYASALPAYSTLTQDGTSFTAPMAIGFWLRRKADGTASEVWTGLGKLMTLYDLAYFTSSAKK